MKVASGGTGGLGGGVRASVFRVLGGGIEDGFQRQCGLFCVSVFLALREEDRISLQSVPRGSAGLSTSNVEKALSDLKRVI